MRTDIRGCLSSYTEYTIGIIEFSNFSKRIIIEIGWRPVYESIDERIFRVTAKERSNQVQGNSANGNAARVPFGGYLKCHSRAQASIKGHRSLCGETTVLFVGLVVRKINLPKIRTPPRSSRSCISLKRFKLLKP